MTLAPRAGKDALSVFRECFGAPRALVGMLHLGALPGTPSASHSVETLIQQALTEAQNLPGRRIHGAGHREHARPPVSQGWCRP